MTDRPGIEKEIVDARKSLGQIEKDVKQLRDWIAGNERSLNGMQETLRRITEEGISRARADLAERETGLQRLRETLAHNDRLLNLLNEIDRKANDIATLEREQEKTIVLLERHRTELRQLQSGYDELTRPNVLPPCELVLPNNQRVSLDGHKGEYIIGWHDAKGGPIPDIDLHALGGSAQGVSRRHAVLRFAGGQWHVLDLASTNGTFLNDVPVAPNTLLPIADKTKIRLGNIMMFFRYVTQTTRL
ncbi:MAG: FHA domain-containing protein [Chloroflexales bacterium]|nr:FHA domain-containing protein [Chloroflexales bacterium]